MKNNIQFLSIINNKIRNYVYILIPMISIGIWALLCLLFVEKKFLWDYGVFYKVGKLILNDPINSFNLRNRNFTFPSFVSFFAITYCLLPFEVGYYLWYLTNFIMAILMIIEFNRILIIMNIKLKWHRFLFLIVITNGYLIYYQFFSNHNKFLLAVIFLFILRRELKYRAEKNEKNLKFYFINYFLFIFAIGMLPPLIFFFLLYIFHDIQLKNIFKKPNILKYCIAALSFITQNFLFVIYPSLIFDFLNNGFNDPENLSIFQIFYLSDFLAPPTIYLLVIRYFCIVIIIIITLVLIINKKLELEKKFGYLSISYVFFEFFNFYKTFIVLLPLILLLFIPYINLNEKGFNFIKKNKIFFVGILSIFGIYLSPETVVLFKYFLFLQNFPFYILVLIRWIILFFFMILSLSTLFYRKYKLKKEIVNGLSN